MLAWRSSTRKTRRAIAHCGVLLRGMRTWERREENGQKAEEAVCGAHYDHALVRVISETNDLRSTGFVMGMEEEIEVVDVGDYEAGKME